MENNDEVLVPYKFSDLLRKGRINKDPANAERKKQRNRRNNRIASKSRRANLKKGLGK